MGPKQGTDEYKNQVETIKGFVSRVWSLGKDAVNSALLIFVLDTSYSRAAICQAESEVRREKEVEVKRQISRGERRKGQN